MTTKTTRRRVLAGMAGGAVAGAAGTAVAAIPASTSEATGESKALLTLYREFEDVLAEYVEADKRSSELYDTVCDATADLHDLIPRTGFGSREHLSPYHRWIEEFDRQSQSTGYGKAHEAVGIMGERLRTIATRLLSTPPSTLHGVIIKLKVMSALERDYEDAEIIDGYDEWREIVVADLERLAAGGVA